VLANTNLDDTKLNDTELTNTKLTNTEPTNTELTNTKLNDARPNDTGLNKKRKNGPLKTSSKRRCRNILSSSLEGRILLKTYFFSGLIFIGHYFKISNRLY
jgi:uncharacterized protein YjbI with pentapeptide repeats